MQDGNFLDLTDTEKDQHIYRIMPEEYVYALFKNNQNMLSQPHNWKDKFENFQLRLGGVLNGEKFTYSFKNDFVGQCWTMENLSEAMWGIYANDPTKRYLRVRSTPRKLLEGLTSAHPKMPNDTCFVGKVGYKTKEELQTYLQNDGHFAASSLSFAKALFLKRRAFAHECEVRMIFFGDDAQYDSSGRYFYRVDPHQMITQIMADPHRDRQKWLSDKDEVKGATGFTGAIKRSKIYDPPDWDMPSYS